MTVKVPLWGVFLTGFTMLFAVAFQQLGFIGAMDFVWFIAKVSLSALLMFGAYIAILVALASGVVTFLDGLKRVPHAKDQRHFVNCFIVSIVFVILGVCFAGASACIDPLAFFTTLNPFKGLVFGVMYIVSLLISVLLRYMKKNWFVSW